MAFHAKLSPSAAHRWMNCAGSVQLIGDTPSTAGIEAHRGTAAHKVIETMLKANETDASAYLHRMIHVEGVSGDAIIYPPEHNAEEKEGWFLFECDETMVNGVQLMIDEIERVKEDEFLEATLYTERFLDMSWLDDRLGGTADVTLYEPYNWIHLFDYKNGRIVVEVKDNEQMKNYALGLLHEHPEAAGVVVHLVQPNALHEEGTVREARYTADELKLFEITLKEAADATSKPNAPRRAGDWCTFCPAKIRCPEFEATMLAEAGADFADDPPESLPITAPETSVEDGDYAEELARKARWIPVLDMWARNLKQAIFNELANGRVVPGFKLVRGKANRQWFPDEATLLKVMEEKWHIPREAMYIEKLRSPAQVEKLTGYRDKKIMKSIVASLAHKPDGKIVVADDNDPREAVDSSAAAAADFADDSPEDFLDA